jgi:LAS superfamily LD-carboxypeptidase LdcB
LNELELTGRARGHVVAITEPACTVHVHVATPFLKLRDAARAAGFDLRAVSSFRDFDRQIVIWNGKYGGERPLADADGRPLDAAALAPEDRIEAILRWSALPGASRHHWGTDVDVIDAAAVPADYRVQLSAAEFAPAGPFGPLAQWLEEHAARFGFFRPYRGILSGVSAEPWHFSFAPVAEMARAALGPPVLAAALADAPILGKEFILRRLGELHARYVADIDWP